MFQKLKENTSLRISGVVVCILFILGAASNDGLTGWVLGIPFILFLYLLFPSARLKRALVTVAFGVFMVSLSYGKDYTSVVYPVVGQTVTVTHDFSVTYYDYDSENFYVPFDREGYMAFCEGPDCEPYDDGSRTKFKTGDVFYVTRILTSHPDLALTHQYILVNEQGEEVRVYNNELNSSYSQDKTNSFCNKVHWEICSEIGNNPFDPMAYVPRKLSMLMNYPLIPTLVLEKIFP